MQLNLSKSVQTLQLNLKKRDMDTIVPCQVKVAMDVSGSFHSEHTGGHTQKLLSRFVPFAMVFDKDKVIDFYTFSHKEQYVGVIDENNYSTYIQDKVIYGVDGYNGGTEYHDVIEHIIQDASKDVPATKGFLGFGKKAATKAEKELIFFVTDGETDREDARKTKQLISQSSPENIFYIFISISEYDIDFFKGSFDNTPNSSYLRFTLDDLRNLQNKSDEQINDLLLTQNLIDWMKK